MAGPWPGCEKTMAAAPEARAEQNNVEGSRHVARILVVEDDPHIRDLIVLHLGLEGLETEAVADGRDALVRGQSGSFDLIILDLMLPGVDGIAVAAHPARTRTCRSDADRARRRKRQGAGLERRRRLSVKLFGIRELWFASALFAAVAPSQLQAEAASAGERPVGSTACIDPARRRVRQGDDVDLTARSFDYRTCRHASRHRLQPRSC